MRWDCGESWPEKVARLEQWHEWFAWHPVRVASHDCRWLEKVERIGQFRRVVGWSWEYRPKSAPTAPHSAETG